MGQVFPSPVAQPSLPDVARPSHATVAGLHVALSLSVAMWGAILFGVTRLV